MTMEGTVKSRNGRLYVLYTYDESSAPFRQYMWWPVLAARGSGYGDAPEAGDIAASVGGGEWRTRNPLTHRSTGSVSTGPGATQAETVERVSVDPPPARGKELRWHEGRWEKLLAKGWVPASEGKAPKKGVSHSTRRYGKKASEKIARTMHEFKHGTLRSGSGAKVTSRDQAIAIGISQARRAGYKVPTGPAHATEHGGGGRIIEDRDDARRFGREGFFQGHTKAQTRAYARDDYGVKSTFFLDAVEEGWEAARREGGTGEQAWRTDTPYGTGSGHATRRKTPTAQLNREIHETLSRASHRTGHATKALDMEAHGHPGAYLPLNIGE